MTLETSQVSVQVKEMRKTSRDRHGIKRRVQGWLTKTIAWSWRVTRGPWVCTTDQRKIGLCSMNKLSLITFRRASLVAMWLRICLQCRRRRFDPWVGKIP